MRRRTGLVGGALVTGCLAGVLAGAPASTSGTPAGAPVWTTLASYDVAPGVSYEQFTLTDARGQVRGQLMRIDPATPGLAFDLASGGKVASRHPVPEMMDDDAVAAVNGDFFDIRDTEAPEGVAVDRQRGLRNGVESGWNDAFWVDPAGLPHIGTLSTTVTVEQRPDLDVATVNSPSVQRGGVGLYTKAWGTLSGYRVVDGQHRRVRMVIVRGGLVVANRTRFPSALAVHGLVLVGRDAGARRLAGLRVGQPVTPSESLSQPAVVAVTGSNFLLLAGQPTVAASTAPRGTYPRTGVGIDEDTGQVLLLVIDGRQSVSRGYSLLDLTKLFQRLGADDALNLDGGGSSIMVGRLGDGTLAVLNSPSDGHPRPVANGLEVTYDAPAGS
jgi:hypothetical protein